MFFVILFCVTIASLYGHIPMPSADIDIINDNVSLGYISSNSVSTIYVRPKYFLTKMNAVYLFHINQPSLSAKKKIYSNTGDLKTLEKGCFLRISGSTIDYRYDIDEKYLSTVSMVVQLSTPDGYHARYIVKKISIVMKISKFSSK